MKQKKTTHPDPEEVEKKAEEQVQEMNESAETAEKTEENSTTCEDKDQIITEQKAKINELNDKYLRLYAEFDNFRRRTAKERIELSKSAASELILSLLPVLDDYERALAAMPEDAENSAIREGILLIYNKYKNILIKNGLEEIKALGEDFNTDLHEAIANVAATEESQKGKIVDLVEKGYYLNGVVLRFAKVVVAN
jgi:molecular chaperone GrpE